MLIRDNECTPYPYHTDASMFCDAFLVWQLSSQQDCIVDHLAFQCCAGIKRLEHPLCPSEHAGALFEWCVMCDICVMYVFLLMFHVLVLQQVLFRSANNSCGWDKRAGRVWCQRLSFLILKENVCMFPEKLQPLWEHARHLPSVWPPLLPQHRVRLHVLNVFEKWCESPLTQPQVDLYFNF